MKITLKTEGTSNTWVCSTGPSLAESILLEQKHAGQTVAEAASNFFGRPLTEEQLHTLVPVLHGQPAPRNAGRIGSHLTTDWYLPN